MRNKTIKHEYSPLPLPISKPFEMLNQNEAKLYFEWFVSHVDERAQYVQTKVCEYFNLSLESIDYSMESIILVWKWFLQAAEIQLTSASRIRKIRKELKDHQEPIGFINDVVQANIKELSLNSIYMVRDIGMYVGKAFIMNYPAIRWDYHTDTKKDSFANIPQLFGFVNDSYNPPFEMQFDPIHYAEMAASNLLDSSALESDLYDYCIKWTRWIPKAN